MRMSIAVLRRYERATSCARVQDWHSTTFSSTCIVMATRTASRAKRPASSAELDASGGDLRRLAAHVNEVNVTLGHIAERVRAVDIPNNARELDAISTSIDALPERMVLALNPLWERLDKIAAAVGTVAERVGFSDTNFTLRVFVCDPTSGGLREKEVVLEHVSLDWTVRMLQRVASRKAGRRLGTAWVQALDSHDRVRLDDPAATLRECDVCTEDRLVFADA